MLSLDYLTAGGWEGGGGRLCVCSLATSGKKRNAYCKDIILKVANILNLCSSLEVKMIQNE